MGGYWHNFDTGQADYRDKPTTDEEALPYLPQGPARGLFKTYRKLGKSLDEAYVETLERVVGIKSDDTPPAR